MFSKIFRVLSDATSLPQVLKADNLWSAMQTPELSEITLLKMKTMICNMKGKINDNRTFFNNSQILVGLEHFYLFALELNTISELNTNNTYRASFTLEI